MEILDKRLKSFSELESFGITYLDHLVYEEFGTNLCLKDGRMRSHCHGRIHTLYYKKLPVELEAIAWSSSLPLAGLGYSPRVRFHQSEPNSTRGNWYGWAPWTLRDREGSLPTTSCFDSEEHVEMTYLRFVYDASAKCRGRSSQSLYAYWPVFDLKIMDNTIADIFHLVAVTADNWEGLPDGVGNRRWSRCPTFLVGWWRNQPEAIILRFTWVKFLVLLTLRYNSPSFWETLFNSPRVGRKAIAVDLHWWHHQWCKNEDHSYMLYMESNRMLRNGGFNLRMFATNSRQLHERIGREEASPDTSLKWEHATESESMLGCTQKVYSEELKVLGVRWNIARSFYARSRWDCLFGKGVATIRNIVSLVWQVLLPIGIDVPSCCAIQDALPWTLWSQTGLGPATIGKVVGKVVCIKRRFTGRTDCFNSKVLLGWNLWDGCILRPVWIL